MLTDEVIRMYVGGKFAPLPFISLRHSLSPSVLAWLWSVPRPPRLHQVVIICFFGTGVRCFLQIHLFSVLKGHLCHNLLTVMSFQTYDFVFLWNTTKDAFFFLSKQWMSMGSNLVLCPIYFHCMDKIICQNIFCSADEIKSGTGCLLKLWVNMHTARGWLWTSAVTFDLELYEHLFWRAQKQCSLCLTERERDIRSPLYLKTQSAFSAQATPCRLDIL